MSGVYVGCAGWVLPRSEAESFPGRGSHLERYAGRFGAVEIDSSFYRSHLPRTYSRWAASVGPGFRFAVKVPREITHVRRLLESEEPLRVFLSEVNSLGSNLGPLIVQLPPGLPFVNEVARSFFATLRVNFAGKAVCEPRHASWFAPEADEILAAYRVGRVAADPAVVPQAGRPGGWNGIIYYRLHGSPKIYCSSYSQADLARLAVDLAGSGAHAEAWCIFDNTAENAALENALELLRLLKGQE